MINGRFAIEEHGLFSHSAAQQSCMKIVVFLRAANSKCDVVMPVQHLHNAPSSLAKSREDGHTLPLVESPLVLPLLRRPLFDLPGEIS